MVWLTGWGYRKKITIDASLVDSTQTDLPVLIKIASDSDLASKALSTGYDLCFTQSDGETKLDYHRFYYSDSTGQFIAMVRIPSLSSSVDTEIYLYYGNPDATDQQDSEGTFSSDFAFVHPMGNINGSGDLTDLTTNDRDATGYGSTTTNADGKIHKAFDFDGSSDYFTMEDFSYGPHLAFFGWINLKSTHANNQYPCILNQDDYNSCPSFELYVGNSREVFQNLWDDDDTGTDQSRSDPASGMPNDDSWHFFANKTDSSGNKTMMDGSWYDTDRSVNGGDAISPIGQMYLGAEVAGGYKFQGAMEFICMMSSSTEISDDFIEAIYRTTNDPTSYYTLDDEELGVSPGFVSTWSILVSNTIQPVSSWSIKTTKTTDPLIVDEETLEDCTTTDTQSGVIPGTDLGLATASGGDSISFFRTVQGSGEIVHRDDSAITNVLRLWNDGELNITEEHNTFEITVKTSSDFNNWAGGGRFSLDQYSTGYKLFEQFTVQAGLIAINNGTVHYKDGVIANSTTYVLKFVIDWENETFSMYIDGVLHDEYKDLAFQSGWTNSNCILEGRCRWYCPGGATTSTRYLTVLGWRWLKPNAGGKPCSWAIKTTSIVGKMIEDFSGASPPWSFDEIRRSTTKDDLSGNWSRSSDIGGFVAKSTVVNRTTVFVKSRPRIPWTQYVDFQYLSADDLNIGVHAGAEWSGDNDYEGGVVGMFRSSDRILYLGYYNTNGNVGVLSYSSALTLTTETVYRLKFTYEDNGDGTCDISIGLYTLNGTQIGSTLTYNNHSNVGFTTKAGIYAYIETTGTAYIDNYLALPVDSLLSSWTILKENSSQKSCAWEITSGKILKDSAWNILIENTEEVSSSWIITSEVDTQIVTSWDVLKERSLQITSAWDILKERSSQKTTSWNILIITDYQITSTWIIVKENSTQKTTSWIILKANEVSKITQWDILRERSSDKTSSWDILKERSTTKQISWDVLRDRSTTKNSAWNIEVSRIVSQTSSSWLILKSNAPTLSCAWSILLANDTQKTSSWIITKENASQKVTSWDVLRERSISLNSIWRLVGEGAEQIEVDSSWDILKERVKQPVSTWVILISYTSLKTSSWVILKEHQSQKTVSWIIEKSNPQQIPSSWDVLRERSSQKICSWTILLSNIKTKNSSWNLLFVTQSGKTSTWIISKENRKLKTSSWDILKERTKIKFSDWRILTQDQTQLSSSWIIVIPAEIQIIVTSSWDILKERIKTLQTSWTIISSRSKTKTSQWDILTQSTSLKLTSWNVLKSYYDEIDSDWKIRSEQSSDKVSRWFIWTGVLSPKVDATVIIKDVHEIEAIITDVHNLNAPMKDIYNLEVIIEEDVNVEVEISGDINIIMVSETHEVK